jgi:hypothetical protein
LENLESKCAAEPALGRRKFKCEFGERKCKKPGFSHLQKALETANGLLTPQERTSIGGEIAQMT